MTEVQKKAYHNKVDENIKTHGYHMTFVFDHDSPIFCYPSSAVLAAPQSYFFAFGD